MSIWKGDATVEQLNRLHVGSLSEHLGIVLTEIGPDFLRGMMPVDDRTCMPFGTVHGGASVALAETLGSVAANACVDLRHQSCVGLEVNANHIRSAPLGTIVTGIARPIHIGRTSQVWSIDVTDSDGRLVCAARLTMAVLDRPPPKR